MSARGFFTALASPQFDYCFEPLPAFDCEPAVVLDGAA
jgi:hypothetical protein